MPAAPSDALLQPTGAYAELAFATLAHLPAPAARATGAAAAASIHDARWLAWARQALPPEVREALGQDAGAVAAALAGSTEATLALQALPGLHRHLDELQSTARLALAEVDVAQTADAGVLEMLRAAPTAPIELVRGAMLLALPGWRTAWPAVHAELEAARARCASSFVQARAISPRLARTPVQLSHALGCRGRAIGERVWVGAPLAWNDHAPDDAALWALHEVAVLVAGAVVGAAGITDAWALEEAVAIATGTRLVAGTSLAAAHARWLGRLSLADLGEPRASDVDAAIDAMRR